MKKLIPLFTALAVLAGAPIAGQASPADDLAKFQAFYKKRFPKVEFNDFANGAYAIDQVSREAWEAVEEFPPYEAFVDEGEGMWNKPFANGKTYKDCFPDGPGVADQYPRWEADKQMVMTLALAINNCREANGEKPLKYKKGPLASLLSYMAFQSRGKATNVVIPNDPKALEAYEDGKKFYYTKRGQLNFSCANCHVQSPGMLLRSETLSPALGHTTHWPVYRAKWGEMGTLHRRFGGCNEQVRAKAFKPQGQEYRNLEYFLTYMSNGLPLNGPGSRK